MEFKELTAKLMKAKYLVVGEFLQLISESEIKIVNEFRIYLWAVFLLIVI